MNKYKTILIAIIMMLVLVSCSKEEQDDTVRVWMYRYVGYHGDMNLKDIIKSEITNYARENNIKLEFIEYSDEELPIDDYILKRNLALEHGGADIVIGDMNSNMFQIADYAGDYTKLSNYKNVFDNFKGQYCIPICSFFKTIILDNEVPKSYGIECDKYIMLDEYYEIKQSMKEKGAKLKYNRVEELQLFNYYANKNNLEMIEKDGKYTIDRALGMKTIKEISEEILQHYNYDMDENKRNEKLYSENYEEVIYDESSGRALAQRGEFYPLKFLSYTYDIKTPYDNFSVVIRNDIEECMKLTPCLLINKNTKKDNSYKIADFLLSDAFQINMYKNTLAYSTIIDTPETKEKIGYSNDWVYNYSPAKTKVYNEKLNINDINSAIGAVQKSYEIFKNIDTNKFFNTPMQYVEAIRVFIIIEVYKIIEDPDYDEAEFNKNADEFLTNFNVQYN